MQKNSYRLSSSLMVQNIDDESLLMDTKTQLFYELNESAAFIFSVMQKHTLFSDVVTELSEYFDASPEVLLKDLYQFASSLADQEMIEIYDRK